ncbi:MAG TPA: hypothetical protein VGG10_09515 [Rhizomicrobium sp.]|jgi:hypothetical protein
MREDDPGERERYAGFGRFRLKLPRSRPIRIGLGIALCFGGLLFFLPILGLWMLPLGVVVLATDLPLAARAARWFERQWNKKKGPGDKPGPKALGNGGVSSREDTDTMNR